MDQYAIIGFVTFALLMALFLASRVVGRRGKPKEPLDPESVEVMRAAEREEAAVRQRKINSRHDDSIGY